MISPWSAGPPYARFAWVTKTILPSSGLRIRHTPQDDERGYEAFAEICTEDEVPCHHPECKAAGLVLPTGFQESYGDGAQNLFVFVVLL